MIPKDKYAEIMKALPILCVDIIIKNTSNEYLLIKRAYEPLKGVWWVAGGRVLKGETLEQAAKRKVKEEIGVIVDVVYPVGYYEDVFETNPFGLSTPLHSVSLVFSTIINNDNGILLDDQSTDWKYSKELPLKFKIKSFGS